MKQEIFIFSITGLSIYYKYGKMLKNSKTVFSSLPKNFDICDIYVHTHL